APGAQAAVGKGGVVGERTQPTPFVSAGKWCISAEDTQKTPRRNKEDSIISAIDVYTLPGERRRWRDSASRDQGRNRHETIIRSACRNSGGQIMKICATLAVSWLGISTVIIHRKMEKFVSWPTAWEG